MLSAIHVDFSRMTFRNDSVRFSMLRTLIYRIDFGTECHRVSAEFPFDIANAGHSEKILCFRMASTSSGGHANLSFGQCSIHIVGVHRTEARSPIHWGEARARGQTPF